MVLSNCALEWVMLASLAVLGIVLIFFRRSR